MECKHKIISSPDSTTAVAMSPVSHCHGPIKTEYDVPSLELSEFDGDYGFDIRLSQSNQPRTSCFYSNVLEQVFIDIQKTMLVHFSLSIASCGLYVRALPVYSAPENFHIPVNRCTVHSVEDDPGQQAHINNECNCLQYNNVGHVIQTPNEDAQYCYDHLSKRHSVIVPIKPFQPGSHGFAIPYIFTCKTSCRKGMQRRPISIVFTLESAFGQVFARKLLRVRICRCPKRDLIRLEQEALKVKHPYFQAPIVRKRGRPSNAGTSKDKVAKLIQSLINASSEIDSKLTNLGEKMHLLSEFGENLTF